MKSTDRANGSSYNCTEMRDFDEIRYHLKIWQLISCHFGVKKKSGRHVSSTNLEKCLISGKNISVR